MSAKIAYRVGSVLRAVVLDSNGVNPKPRRMVLIQDYHEGEAPLCVAITGTPSGPVKYRVELPFDPSGRCHTGLDKRCWAEACFIPELEFDEIQRSIGRLKADDLEAVQDAYDQYLLDCGLPGR